MLRKPNWWPIKPTASIRTSGSMVKSSKQCKTSNTWDYCNRPGFKAWGDLQDCTDNSSTDKVKDHLEWQEHHTKVQDQTDALLGLLHIPICLRIMDLNKRPRKDDTGHRDEMLSQTPRHLVFSYKDHNTNEEVRKQIQSIGPFDDLLTTVKKRKLKWYGHVVRIKGLAKTILQGTVQGQRARGRQRKRWEDNTREWTGLKLGEALREAEDREGWRELLWGLLWYPNGLADFGICKM